MVSHVFLALIIGGERFQAYVTQEICLDIVNTFYVHTKLVLSSVGCLTVVTVEANLRMNRFLMSMQMHRGFECLFTERALIIPNFRMRLQMSLQASCILELKTADATFDTLTRNVDQPNM